MNTEGWPDISILFTRGELGAFLALLLASLGS